MSYARWSSDDFQCDVYVWADVCGDWRTAVATNRCVFKEPLPEPVNYPPADAPEPERKVAIEAWISRHQKVMAMVDAADRVEIGLPHDGEFFNDATPGECADRLVMLREVGYNVPQYAIDALREEAAS